MLQTKQVNNLYQQFSVVTKPHIHCIGEVKVSHLQGVIFKVIQCFNNVGWQ